MISQKQRGWAAFYSIVLTLFLFADAGAQTNKATQYPFKVEVTGRGRPMILIPGLYSSGQVWESTVARYKAKYECHVLTLAGIAGEPPMTTPSLEKMRQGLADYIRVKKLRKPVVVGHSMGGFVALWLAGTEPELVDRLIIIDVLPYPPALQDPAAIPEKMKPPAEALRKAMLAQSSEQRQQSQAAILQTMITDPANVVRATQWGLSSDPGTVAQFMYEMLTTDLRPNLHRIKAPTLVIGTWAGLRQFLTREQVEKNFREQYVSLPGVKFVMSENSKHFVMFDDPEFLFKQIDGFLAG